MKPVRGGTVTGAVHPATGEVAMRWFRTITLFTLALLTWASCSDDPSSPGPPDDGSPGPPADGLSPVILTDPHAALGPAALALPNLGAGEVTYVSLRPGSLASAAIVIIRNLSDDGDPVAVPVVSGGFDPVAVLAGEGDVLELEFRHQNGNILFRKSGTVPVRSPPVIVRTSPPPGRTDVALAIRPLIVFSEPVDPASLDGEVRLLQAGTEVAGEAAVHPAEPWVVQFTPATALQAGTEYHLEAGAGVVDADGDTLPEAYAIEFTTIAGGPPPPPPPPPTAFLWGMVVDESGTCIVDATATVVAGQRLGQSINQITPCNVWSYYGGFLFVGLTPGIEMTLRVAAPGYAPEERIITPWLGPQTAVIFAPSRN